MCISQMSMEIHFSDTGGRRESVEKIDPGPSLEEIIISMQQHLRCSGEASDVVYSRSRGNGTDGLCGGVDSTRGGVTKTSLLSHTVYTAPWTYDSATIGIYGDNDASECEEVPLPVLTREMLRRHTNAENEYGVNREQVQEHHFQETDSVREALVEREEGDGFLDPAAHPRLSTPFYQQLRVKYPQAFQRRSSTTSMTSEASSVCPDHNYLDTISSHSPENGLPPRPPLPLCSRKGVNFCVDGSKRESGDTSIVGCTQRWSRLAERGRIPTPLQGILKKDTPFPGAQSTTTDTSVDSQLSLKERLNRNRETFRHLMSDENSPFGRRKNVCDRSLNRAASPSASVPLNTVQSVCTDGPTPKRSLADGSNRRHVRTKRFASPDSTQDSAVDMDSASVQSVQIDTIGISSPETQQANSACTPGLSKLRCRQRVGADQNSDWFKFSKPPTGIGAVNHGKDSDEDSGIAYGCHSEAQIPGYSLGPGSASNNHSSGPSRTNRKDHSIAALSTVNGPLQIHHSIGQHEDLETDYNHERQINTMETPMLTGQPSSLTQKYREVTFEDEIPHQPLYRACSQPLLNSCSEAPPGVRTLHRVLHFGGEISDTERSRHKTPHKLTRYHSEEDLLDGPVGTRTQCTSRGQAFNRRCASAMAEVITSINHENIESSMEIHRASPAVVLPVSTNQHMRNKPPRPPAANKRQQFHQCLSSPGSSGNSSERGVHTLSDQKLDEEVMRANGFITDKLDLHSQRSDRKRFQLPWRKNRGHYTPSKEIKKMAKAQSYGCGASCSSCASGDSSLCGHQMALMNGRSGSAQPRNCQTLNMKTPVTPLSEIRAPSGGNYETAREIHAPVNTVFNGNTSLKYPAQVESDYETIDAIKKMNKINHDCAKPPTGRKTNKKRHVAATSDGDYEMVSDVVESMENNCCAQSQMYVDSDYATVDVISRTMKPHCEPNNRNGSVAGLMDGHVNGNTATQQDHTHTIYAEVDFTKKTRKTTSCSTTECDESITNLPLPPVPFRGYESDLQRHRGLSGSRTSLADKMGGFRQSMKRKFSRLRKAVSLDRLDKADCPASEPSSGLAGSRWKSPSLTSLTSHFKRANRDSRKAKRLSKHAKRQSASMTDLDDAETPKKFQPIGRLKRINCDSTQMIELSKPEDGPFGFYIARGSAKYNHGIFVSRLSDSLPGHFFGGLINVGDEILEINGTSMKNISLEETYDLMSRQNLLLLKIMPFMARRDP